MAQYQKEFNTSTDDVNEEGQHLVSLWFENDSLSDFAVMELFKKGYKPNDIAVIAHQDLFKRPCQVLGESVDTRKEVVKKAVYGLKIGGALGGILTIIGTSIAIFIQAINPSLQLLLLIFVGAIWGGMLGFLIGQFFPLHERQYYELKLIDGNVLIQFWTKFNERKRYFKHMNWTLCQIGKPYQIGLNKEL